jgi:hypothetical protein
VAFLLAHCSGFLKHPRVNTLRFVATLRYVRLRDAKPPIGIINGSTIGNDSEAKFFLQQAGQSTLAGTGFATDHYDLPSFHVLLLQISII